jgi:tRNA1(Val) A37 N6-methylase TrmN6
VPKASPRSGASAVADHLGALDARRARGGVSQRKAQGAHYTPAALVAHLVGEAIRGWRPSLDSWRLLDPACGSGNFLLAAARSLAARTGEPMHAVLAKRVHGVDIDPVAVKLARAALLDLLPPRTGSATRSRVRAALAKHIVVADALQAESGETYDLVLGNPPFLNQLEKGTVTTRAQAERIARATGGAVRRYADLAAAFLLMGLGRLAPGGRLAFVMPQSFLSTSDARAARDAAITLASLRAIWSSNEAHFEDASVRVCAVVLERGRPRTVRRAFGARFDALRGVAAHPRHGDESWAPLLAEGFGAPRIEVAGGGAIADIATATADFRDQYYGLRGAVEENGRGPRLATTRHIDLCACAWGECEVRVLGERFVRPTIDAARIAGRKGMDGWLESRLVPKVIVATQTRVIEAFVDERGEYAPLVPLISVFPREGVDLWRLAAAVASPVVAARALALYAGSALGAGAIKLSARQLLAMPLPSNARAWTRSAALLKKRDFAGFARASCEAHALSAGETRETMRFWNDRA